MNIGNTYFLLNVQVFPFSASTKEINSLIKINHKPNKTEDKKDDSNKNQDTSNSEIACDPTPVVDNKTVFDDYKKAVESAKANGNSIETQEDSCGNTIYVLV